MRAGTGTGPLAGARGAGNVSRMLLPRRVRHLNGMIDTQCPPDIPLPQRIFAFTDPGFFLLECYRELKRSSPGVSHRYLAAALNLKSSAAFGHIVAGRINPGPDLIDGLARVFRLDREQRDFLAILFSLRHLKDPAARRVILERVRISYDVQRI
jgi:hypothetical protein